MFNNIYKKILVSGIIILFIGISLIPTLAGDKVKKTTNSNEFVEYIRYDDFEDYDVGEVPKSERGWSTSGVTSNQYCEAAVDPLDSNNMVMLVHGSSIDSGIWCHLQQDNFATAGEYSVHYRIYTPQLSTSKTIYEWFMEGPDDPYLVLIHRKTGQVRWGGDSYCGGYYEFSPQINPSTSRWIEEEVRVKTDEFRLWHDQSTDALGGYCNDPINGVDTWRISNYPSITQSFYIDDFWITEYNLPPEIPTDPDPSDGEIDVDINSDLSWNCSDGDGENLTFDVYFGDSNPPSLVSSGQTENYYTLDTLDYETQYFWKIIAKDDYGTSAKSPVWDFTTVPEPNDPPEAPSNPDPYDGETDVELNADLYWTCSDPDGDSLTYDVYFGKSNPPPLVSSGQTEMFYSPGVMNYNSQYFWRIVAEDEHGASTSGPIWSFSTLGNDPPETPSNPNPEDGEIDVDPEVDLSWVCIDPDGDDIIYNIYFGEYSPPPLVASSYHDTIYNPGTMNYDTTYYWSIDAEDENGFFTDGPIWSFTTVDKDPPKTPVINGPQVGKTGINYTYTFVSEEPNDDNVFYQINWGDGTIEDWFGPYESDEIVTKHHTWNKKGNYTIMARAKDLHDNIGEWGTFTVTMPRDKAISKSMFLWFLEKFPILQQLIHHLWLK